LRNLARVGAAIIAVAQRVEHYETARHGCARTFARMLGDEDAAKLLQETLDEEGEEDKKLTENAESLVNLEAAGTERQKFVDRAD
jgi:ferritin-like metal-binding protein YciE